MFVQDPSHQNHFDEMAELNFKFLKQIVDDRQFGEVLVGRLLERFWRVMREGVGRGSLPDGS